MLSTINYQLTQTLVTNTLLQLAKSMELDYWPFILKKIFAITLFLTMKTYNYYV
jgi:hypothetical protein